MCCDPVISYSGNVAQKNSHKVLQKACENVRDTPVHRCKKGEMIQISSVGERINEWCYVYTTEYYTAVKIKGWFQIYQNFKSIMQSKIK